MDCFLWAFPLKQKIFHSIKSYLGAIFLEKEDFTPLMEFYILQWSFHSSDWIFAQAKIK